MYFLSAEQKVVLTKTGKRVFDDKGIIDNICSRARGRVRGQSFSLSMHYVAEKADCMSENI